MKIGINAQILTDGRTGVTRYAKNVIQLLPEIGKEHEFIVFGNPRDISLKQNNATLVPTSENINSSTKRIIWEQAFLPHLIKKNNIDLMYYPDHTAPLIKIKPKVIITIHDVSTFAVPETVGIARRLYKQAVIKRSAKLCDGIITVSKATKNEIAKYLPWSINKVQVVLNGIEDSFVRISDKLILSSIKAKYGITKPFILHVGTIEARKNILRIVYAFAKGKKTRKWKQNLVLAGLPGYGFAEIKKAIASEGIEDSVIFTGHVENDDLAGIYSLADVLIYPSLYEGFGFPPLEAMKCGCPVVASYSTSLPEVIGDAGIFIDPRNADKIFYALNRIVSSKKLRTKLIQLGSARAELYNWKKTVKGILRVMQDL